MIIHVKINNNSSLLLVAKKLCNIFVSTMCFLYILVLVFSFLYTGFRYRKDSVMEVNETEYKRCNSSHPNFFSNNGNSVFRLNQPGPFYFISGVSGHCEKGQRMIVKVMSHEEESPSGGGGGKSSSGSHVAVSSLGVSALVFLQFVLSFVASNVI